MLMIPYQDSRPHSIFKIINQQIDITFLSPQSFSVIDGQIVIGSKKAFLDALVLNLLSSLEEPLTHELKMRHIFSQKHQAYFTQFFGKFTPVSTCCKMPLQFEIS